MDLQTLLENALRGIKGITGCTSMTGHGNGRFGNYVSCNRRYDYPGHGPKIVYKLQYFPARNAQRAHLKLSLIVADVLSTRLGELLGRDPTNCFVSDPFDTDQESVNKKVFEFYDRFDRALMAEANNH